MSLFFGIHFIESSRNTQSNNKWIQRISHLYDVIVVLGCDHYKIIFTHFTNDDSESVMATIVLNIYILLFRRSHMRHACMLTIVYVCYTHSHIIVCVWTIKSFNWIENAHTKSLETFSLSLYQRHSDFHGNRKNENGDKNIGAEVLNANIIFALTLSHRTAKRS